MSLNCPADSGSFLEIPLVGSKLIPLNGFLYFYGIPFTIQQWLIGKLHENGYESVN